jgi:hypothetical protein
MANYLGTQAKATQTKVSQPDAHKIKATSFRLSDDARWLAASLSAHLGIPMTSVVEIAIRKLAETEGIKK